MMFKFDDNISQYVLSSWCELNIYGRFSCWKIPYARRETV